MKLLSCPTIPKRAFPSRQAEQYAGSGFPTSPSIVRWHRKRTGRSLPDLATGWDPEGDARETKALKPATASSELSREAMRPGSFGYLDGGARRWRRPAKAAVFFCELGVGQMLKSGVSQPQHGITNGRD